MRLRRRPARTTCIATGSDARITDTGRHRVLGTPIRAPWPDGMVAATLGMGCFWSGERAMWSLPGVWSTAAGFTTAHTEVVQVVFDPQVLGFSRLLAAFFAHHDPTVRQGVLYRSVIGVDDPDLAALAKQAVRAETSRRGRPVLTRVVDAGFTYATADQQQYLA